MMASKRGAANLAKFNADRSENTLPLLEHELKLCRKNKLEFKTPGLLAAYLSDRLKIHRTTLTRNKTYFALLLKHTNAQPGAVSLMPDSTLDPVVLQAKLTAAKLEVSNLQQQLRQLSARLHKVESGLPASSGDEDSSVAFSNLAMVLVQLLHRFPDYIELDRDQRALLDRSARPSDRLIVGKERLGQFVQWMEKHQGLPMVGALLLPAPDDK